MIINDDAKVAIPFAGALEVWALGISIVIGGQYFSWNFGLVAGFGSYLIATILISVAYICLCFCTSELTSALPFAGGAYGLARCTLGYYPGFVVGCCETIEYIAYVAVSVYSLGGMIVSMNPDAAPYQPLIWFVFYATALSVQIAGGKVFWNANVVLAIISFLLLLVFCLGSLKFVDFNANAIPDGVWFVGGMSGFMSILRLPTWFFVGVESLNMACTTVREPRKNIPRGQISCVLTLAVTAILVLFITCSLPPGISALSADPIPFNLGTSEMCVCLIPFSLL